MRPATLLLIGFLGSVFPLFATEQTASFVSAKPIWPTGSEKEKNLFVGFRAAFEAPRGKKVVLRCAAATLYRIFLNGKFLGHGPARGPHGFYRVDELNLTDKLSRSRNVVAFEVAGYNANSFYLLDQPSFLQAEVVADGKALASTAGEGVLFEAQMLSERVQKVQRYSFQRPFTEIYRLTPGYARWRSDLHAPFEKVETVVQPNKSFIRRGVPFSNFTLANPVEHIAFGDLKVGVKVERPWRDRSLTGISPNLGGFPENELAEIPSLELQGVVNATTNSVHKVWSSHDRLTLKSISYEILDFGCNLTGFIGAKIKCRQPTRLFFAFDEILSNGDVNFRRLDCVNAVEYKLEPGEYDVESFEPYTMRYLKVIVLEGDCDLADIHLREYANPSVWEADFKASDPRLNQLFAAGRETFRQNAVDIFMDCPSRERAGWLCDSFFTSRVALDLCGNTDVEKNFFENFALPDKFKRLPDGMLPMCYPSDHYDGVFIPNWSLWFVVQLEEYAQRSGDRELVEKLRPRVLKLLEYFKQFRNEDGLLEHLQSWVFVEWSKANEFVQDVNFPSNMLYAKALLAAGKLYEQPDLVADAQKIRDTIRKQSFDGEFFVDNALRRDGKLQVTRNRSEVCQYFAFYFDIASPETHSKLWHTLTKDFGPQRKKTKAFPEIHFANSFVGNVLRLELLSRYGLAQQNLDESIAYLLYMAERTGTLWENDGAYASCNHGFASHAVHVLYRDVLGMEQVDALQKKVAVRFGKLNLESCEGKVPTPDGLIELRWRKESGKLRYKLSVPRGYSVSVNNQSGLELISDGKNYERETAGLSRH